MAPLHRALACACLVSAATGLAQLGGGTRLGQLVAAKHQEVQRLVKLSEEGDGFAGAEAEGEGFLEVDKLAMRLGYAAGRSSLRVTRALRRDALSARRGEEHLVAVAADIKRASPTSEALPRGVASFGDAADVAVAAAQWGADVVFVNTDAQGWGGDVDELQRACERLKPRKVPAPSPEEADAAEARHAAAEDDGGAGAAPVRRHPDDPQPGRPPVVMKDLIVHPLQIALAVERGAAGVYLMACVCGPDLEGLLNTATVLGTEAIVEVHTPQELEYAVHQAGATIVAVNRYDRTDGTLHPNQALALRADIPPNVVTLACGAMLPEDAFRHADAGYDAVVLGRGLAVPGQDPSKSIREIRGRVSPALTAFDMGMGLPGMM